MHNGVEMTVGLCIQLAENSGSDTEMQPYLVSLMFFAMGTKSQELLRECQRLKTIHGGAPLMLPATSNGSDMPDVDDEVNAGEEFGAVESVKAASDLISPVSGTVVEVNEALEDEPGLINKDAFENWIIKVEISDKNELADLMNAQAYTEFCEKQ